MDKYKTPLEYYLECLKQLDYDVAAVELKTCSPLPEVRERVWILGSTDKSYTAEQWKSDVLLLQPPDATPRHHLKSYFDKFGKVPSAQDTGPADWGNEANYAVAYAAAMEGMVRVGKLEAANSITDPNARPSKGAAWKGVSDWAKASVDVYSALASRYDAAAADEGINPDSLYPVCDLSQAPARGNLTVDGTWTTVCTSTKMTSLKEGKVLSGQGLLAVLGQDLSTKDTRFVSDRELTDLAGNAMSFAQLSRVLLPCVKAFAKEQLKGQGSAAV